MIQYFYVLCYSSYVRTPSGYFIMSSIGFILLIRLFLDTFVFSIITIPSILGMYGLCFFHFLPLCWFSKRFVGIIDYSGYIIEERVLSKWKKCMKINLKGFKIFMSGSLLKYSITLGKSV